jgi:virulence-associated protein VapD
MAAAAAIAGRRVFTAMTALKALPWFPRSVRDIRAFTAEHWSDVTSVVRG